MERYAYRTADSVTWDMPSAAVAVIVEPVRNPAGPNTTYTTNGENFCCATVTCCRYAT